MKSLLKGFLILLLISGFVILTLPVYLLGGVKVRYRYCPRVTSWVSRIALRIMGIHVNFHNHEILTQRKSPAMVISNHVSYIDIIMLASSGPLLFVTSVEMKHTFFLGFMSTLGGSLFVERRKISDLRSEIAQMARLLSSGLTICFFPEAKSADGSQILPFKTSLLRAAEEASVDVIPACIIYTTLDDKPVTSENRDRLFYYGSIRFFPHVLGLFSLKSVFVEITIFQPLSFSTYSRKEIGERAYSQITERFYSKSKITRI